MDKTKILIIWVVVFFCFLQSGCAALNAPAKMAGAALNTTVGLTKLTLALLGRMPMPPPGVF